MDVILLTVLVFLAAGVGTLSGFGTSTIMVPILILLYPHPEVLLFVGIIHFFGDIWKMLLFKKGIRWRILILFGVPGIIASYIGATITINVDPGVLLRILGVFLLVYVVFLLFRKKWKIKENSTSAVVGGSLSGFSAGVFGVGGAIRSTFLSMYNLPKEVYLFTSGAIAFFVDITRLGTYFVSGVRLEEKLILGMIVFIPTSLLSAYLAKQIVNKIPQERFRYLIIIFIGLIALKFIIAP